MVNITIRGIEDETYSKFSAEARKEGISIGKLTTQAMTKFLESEKEIYLIENLMELTISKEDLKSLDKKVMIKNVVNVSLDKNIDWKIFLESIFEIRNVSVLSISKNISKFQVLTKCKNVAKIQEI